MQIIEDTTASVKTIGKLYAQLKQQYGGYNKAKGKQKKKKKKKRNTIQYQRYKR